jgi:DNA-directed RNA polymerase subunit RPC12/RpoP
MDDDLRCPTCNTDEHLTGERDGDAIMITCGACGLRWERDPSPACRECGTQVDIKVVLQPLIERSRGTQLSITGLQTIHRCWTCDQRINAAAQHRHIPPGQHPAK